MTAMDAPRGPGDDPRQRSSRNAGRPLDPHRCRRARRRVLRHAVRTRRTRHSGSRSGPRAIAVRRSVARSTRPTSSPSPRRSGGIASARLPRTAVPRARHACAVRAGDADGARGPRRPRASTSGSTRATGSRRRRPSRTRSSSRTGAGRSRPDAPATVRRGLADGIVVTPSHNPPDDGGFKYNPPNGGPADTDVTRLDPGRGEPDARGDAERMASTAIPRVPWERARDGAAPYDFLATYVEDLGSVIDMAAIAASGLRIGVDPMGGASRRLLGRDRRALRARPDGTQRGGRPDVRLHDRRLGREDPDGPVVAVRDGPARRACATGSTSPSGTTPTPTATASSRRGPVSSIRTISCRRPSRTCSVARATWRDDVGVGKTLVVVEHDRPRRRRSRPAARRGPRRVQVVRRWAGRRLDRVRRRGERRRVVPAPRRHGLDDRQGRHHRRACLPAR